MESACSGPRSISGLRAASIWRVPRKRVYLPCGEGAQRGASSSRRSRRRRSSSRLGGKVPGFGSFSEGVQLEAVPRAHAPRAACALPRLRLRDPHLHQPAHVLALVEHRLFRAPRVHDAHGVVDRDRRLGDVGRDDHLAHAVRHALEDGRLLGGRERRVQRQEAEGGGVVEAAVAAEEVEQRPDATA
jgi:hypothetical protein